MSTPIWIVVDQDGTGYKVKEPSTYVPLMSKVGLLGYMQDLVRGNIERIGGLQLEDVDAWVNEEGALLADPVENRAATALAAVLGDPNAPAQRYVGPMLVTGSDGANATEVPEYFENFLVGMFAIDWKTDEPITVEECVEYMDAAREEVTA